MFTTSTLQQISSQANQFKSTSQDEVFLNKKKILSSFLSNSRFNSFVCRDLLIRITPPEFDSIFCDICSSVNQSTTLQFFYCASERFGFRFTLRSYCLLFHVLVCKNAHNTARQFLSRLISRKLPILSMEGADDVNREIAHCVADTCVNFEKFNCGNVVFDILVEVYASQSLGSDVALDVFMTSADRGLFPSCRTCAVLIKWLVKAKKAEKGYKVFEIVSRAILPDFILFNVAIEALCKMGKVIAALDMFRRMEELGVAPDLYTYTILMDGLCKHGSMDRVMLLKEKMVTNGISPNVITYSVMINGLMKLGKCDEVLGILNEMLEKGIAPNTVVYNTIIDGYSKVGNMKTALEVKDYMLLKGISLSTTTYCALIYGLSNIGQVDIAKNLLRDMREESGLLPTVKCYTALIGGYCTISKMDEAVTLLQEMATFNILPSKRTHTVLINGYCKLGRMKEASQHLSDMRKEGHMPNVFCYTALIGGYCKIGQMKEASDHLIEMLKKGIVPDSVTVKVLTNGFSNEEKVEDLFNLWEGISVMGIDFDEISLTSFIHCVPQQSVDNVIN